MRKKRRRATREKHKKRFRVIMEILFMAAGVLCSIMPQPFPLLVPIGIGTVRIINSAVQREKTADTPPVKVYCNGEREHKTTNEERAVKKRTDSTAPPKKSAARSKVKGN